MNKRSPIWVLPLLLCLLTSAKIYAQLDSLQVANVKYVQYANEGKWDSAFFYTAMLEKWAWDHFGDSSFQHADALSATAELKMATGDHAGAYSYVVYCSAILAKVSQRITLDSTQTSIYAGALTRVAVEGYTIGTDSAFVSSLIKSAELFKTVRRMQDFAQAKTILADFYVDRGEYRAGETLFQDIKDALDTLAPSALVSYLKLSLYCNQADMYSKTGNARKCLRYVQKANALCPNLNASRTANDDLYWGDYVSVKFNLAEAYLLNEQMDSARKICLEVENGLHKHQGTPDQYAALIKEKASIYQHQHALTQAISLDTAYVRMVTGLSQKPDDFYETIVNLGILYVDTRQYARADSLLIGAIAALHQQGLDYTYAYQEATICWCTSLIHQQQFSEAAGHLLTLSHLVIRALHRNTAGMSESEQLQYKKGLDAIFDLLYICLGNDPHISRTLITDAYQCSLQRQNIILDIQTHLRNHLRNTEDSALKVLYGQYADNRKRLSMQYSLPVDQRYYSTDSLEEAGQQLEKKLSLKDLMPDLSDTSLSLLSVLEPSSADISFVRFNYKSLGSVKDSAFYAAFIFSKRDSVPVFVSLCSETALLRLMKDRQGKWIDEDQLTGKIYNSDSKNAGELYRLLWKPIEPYLAGLRDIQYSVSGLLNTIAFAALWDGREYLMNKHSLHRFLYLDNQPTPGAGEGMPDAIELWGNMDYSGTRSLSGPHVLQAKNISHSPLQSLGDAELSVLKKICLTAHMHVSVYEDQAATEDNFKRAAPGIEGILHISTHGFYTPYLQENAGSLLPGDYISGIADPMFRCGIAFSGANYYWVSGSPRKNREDGILSGYEIEQLDLHKVALVTLSACETGLGDITDSEGALGLQRAFKLAGVRSMLLSLWQVPAKQTAELLSLFYSNWMQGNGLHESLEKAERTLQQRQYPPYYWAGFVLIQ